MKVQPAGRGVRFVAATNSTQLKELWNDAQAADDVDAHYHQTGPDEGMVVLTSPQPDNHGCSCGSTSSLWDLLADVAMGVALIGLLWLHSRR